mmetsp:Transcript_35415/g.87008  ORF Transcript_35415/g.87008 Transcript_35415/m.87008 type:complete len:393 (-) Transcript_35415:2459-3637(-)
MEARRMPQRRRASSWNICAMPRSHGSNTTCRLIHSGDRSAKWSGSVLNTLRTFSRHSWRTLSFPRSRLASFHACRARLKSSAIMVWWMRHACVAVSSAMSFSRASLRWVELDVERNTWCECVRLACRDGLPLAPESAERLPRLGMPEWAETPAPERAESPPETVPDRAESLPRSSRALTGGGILSRASCSICSLMDTALNAASSSVIRTCRSEMIVSASCAMRSCTFFRCSSPQPWYVTSRCTYEAKVRSSLEAAGRGIPERVFKDPDPPVPLCTDSSSSSMWLNKNWSMAWPLILGSTKQICFTWLASTAVLPSSESRLEMPGTRALPCVRTAPRVRGTSSPRSTSLVSIIVSCGTIPPKSFSTLAIPEFATRLFIPWPDPSSPSRSRPSK